MTTIDVSGVSRRYDGFAALEDVSLRVEPGELLALLGPSGSGKTTLLRIIAGLDFQSSGQVLFDGADTDVRPVGARNVGFVFQHYALFRHMSVFENVAFGLRVRPRAHRPADREIKARVESLLRLVQLDAQAARYPSQLSGGQRQRVALARALAIEPRVLLLDEPFGALDAKVRKDLRRWLRRLHESLHLTTVFVTHDQDEAMDLADRVVVMNQGRIAQVGTPETVYDRPADPFVHEFLGRTNRLNHLPDGGAAEGKVAYVRPENVEIVTAPDLGTVPARITALRRLGPLAMLDLDLASGETLAAELPKSAALRLGLEVGNTVHVRPRDVQVFHGAA